MGSAFSPKSAAALTAERELWDTALMALTLDGWWNPTIVAVKRISDGRIEADFTIQRPGGDVGVRTAWIDTDRGTPIVTARGMPARVPPRRR